MKAKKSLGQHFLRSTRALDAIIVASELEQGDAVLEIGPGEGILTERLLKFAGKVIAVEKDDELFIKLSEKFKKEIKAGNLDLIHDDILNFDPNSLKFHKDFGYKIIANIPYNITGAILEKFLSADYQPERMILLVQKEVAERIVGACRHGVSTRESILSLSVKAYGSPHYVETVKAGSFAPAPKVDSAVIAIENISKSYFANFSEADFFRVIRAGFSSKRKKLSSNLGNLFGKEKVLQTFKKLGLSDNMRAEEADISTWAAVIKDIL